MNSFYLSRNSEGAMRGYQFIALREICYLFNTIFLEATQMNYETFL